MNDAILAGSIKVTTELWPLEPDPPYLTPANFARFEGGTLSFIAGRVATPTDVGHAINPVTGAIAFGTVLGAIHAGRVALVWTSAGAGATYDVVSNTDYALTVAGDLTGLVAGDQLVICDRLSPTAANRHRRVDDVAAGMSLAFDFGELESSYIDPGPIEQIESMSWVFWRQRVWSDAGARGWMPAGVSCLNRDMDEASPDASAVGNTWSSATLRYSPSAPAAPSSALRPHSSRRTREPCSCACGWPRWSMIWLAPPTPRPR